MVLNKYSLETRNRLVTERSLFQNLACSKTSGAKNLTASEIELGQFLKLVSESGCLRQHGAGAVMQEIPPCYVSVLCSVSLGFLTLALFLTKLPPL